MTPSFDVHAENDQRALLAIALDVAREAAELVLSGWRKKLVVDLKGPVDLVTDFDRASEELLRKRLHERTPFPVVGEEAGADANLTPDGARWYVDPIDGTTNFVHGHPFFCVSVGLVAKGQPLLGAVVAPALRYEFTGIAGKFATRNGEPCHVSSVSSFREALLATGFPYDRHVSEDNNFDAFVTIKKKCQAVRRCGSAALDLCFVAEGTYDGYWEKKLNAWDITGGCAIVLGAGGQLSTYGGEPVSVTRGDLVATNGKIHDILVRELAEVHSKRTTK
jgi:myo-inositol-1(or 4)-monophosphatase